MLSSSPESFSFCFNYESYRNSIEKALELSWIISFRFELKSNEKSNRKCSGAILEHFLHILIEIHKEFNRKCFEVLQDYFLCNLLEIQIVLQ